jgi:hypothetical protein
MLKLGVFYYDNRSPDSETSYFLIRALESIADDSGNEAFWLRPELYPKLMDVLEHEVSLREKSPYKAWYRSFQAALAVKQDRLAEARKLIDALDGRPDPSGFSELVVPTDTNIGRVYALSEGRADAVRAAERLFDSTKWEEADPAYRALLAATAKDDRARMYFESRLLQIKTMREYDQGDWVQLDPKQSLGLWSPVRGEWNVDREGGLLGSAKDGYMLIVFDAPLGTRFELVAEVELVGAHHGEAFRAGGVYNLGVRRSTMSFTANARTGIIAFGVANQRSTSNRLKIQENANRFQFLRWDSVLAAKFNTQMLAIAHPIGTSGDSGRPNMGLEAASTNPDTIYRFHGLRIRKPTMPPQRVLK